MRRMSRRRKPSPDVHYAYNGRDSRHIDPSEVGCGAQPTVTNDSLTTGPGNRRQTRAAPRPVR